MKKLAESILSRIGSNIIESKSKILDLIISNLVNNESDTDDSMVKFLAKETKVSPKKLKAIVKNLRNDFLMDKYSEGEMRNLVTKYLNEDTKTYKGIEYDVVKSGSDYQAEIEKEEIEGTKSKNARTSDSKAKEYIDKVI